MITFVLLRVVIFVIVIEWVVIMLVVTFLSSSNSFADIFKVIIWGVMIIAIIVLIVEM